MGIGAFGTVYLANKIGENNKYYAVKTIPKSIIKGKNLDSLQKEIKVM